MWPMCPAFPVRPPKGRPPNTSPPPTPVDTTSPTMNVLPCPAPRQCSPSAMHTPSPASSTRTPGNSSATAARSGKFCHEGTLIGETVPRAASTGPAEAMPTPATTVSPTTVDTTERTASQGSAAGVGTRDERSTEPAESTRPAAILVPPKSSASTRSVTMSNANQ